MQENNKQASLFDKQASNPTQNQPINKSQEPQETSPSALPTNPHQIYFTHKQLAMLLEKNNFSRIIAFPSAIKRQQQNQTNTEDEQNQHPEWYKLGGNSAYFYKYFIAPRFHKKPVTIHPDTDLNHRFKYGFVSINGIDGLIKNMTKLGCTYKQESNLYIFELGHTFTFREVDELRKREQREQAQTNALFRPKHPHPDLYGIILELSKLIPTKAKSLKKGFQHDFAPELNHSVINIAKDYYHYANNQLDGPTTKARLMGEISNLSAVLSILIENDCVDTTTQSRIGRLLADLTNNIERKFHE